VTGNEASRGRTLSAPAKLNLYLHVLGRRSDGYHFLDSLVVFADLADELSFRPDDGLHLSIQGPFAAALTRSDRDKAGRDDNLILRAARHLAAFAGVRCGAAITLTKNLPVAAGIGGGSADAAAALLGLARLWELDLESGDLAGLGLELGADVPVCLKGQATFVEGIGEKLTPVTGLGKAGLLLVNPGPPLSTAAVFQAHGDNASYPAPIEAVPNDIDALARFLKARRNDLTVAAVGLAPVIGEVLDVMSGDKACLFARMSGSGPTCFGLYREVAACHATVAAIRRDHPTWWVAASEMRSDANASA